MNTPTTVTFPKYAEGNGAVYVYECGQGVPFRVERVFNVMARKGDIRGDHAHKKCSQLMVCVVGTIRVICDNGIRKSEHMLTDMNVGLLVPPGVWAQQQYLTDNATLMVLCDRPYEPDDYIRKHADFKEFFSSMNRLD